ncbi:N-acetyllactosaminide beta-1,3-N-acetylglucosaminyltransferase 4-like [Scyliorhinus canicula]|uniref:N-acetyllactosaminide beta-1,3-N-acetylglucosaminyltransferase 4-like n=1 Tax=Scyliorhinus canicula TaxID=7830 RepID=UPI0018F284E0|nr:N-acetyllactosaminide beta-1,3-N-acetylglucosaminyltransferase 4-like [Scyliorhinus canicula]XP_038645777.1 N-acetyllactosaminide beta-1,3-N-acetylglucosaminyltransferase 4-like [Scyliorhinus canicula]
MFSKGKRKTLWLALIASICVFVFKWQTGITATKKDNERKHSILVPQVRRNITETTQCLPNREYIDQSSNLPKMYQKFLAYKHCRTFQALLKPKECTEGLFLLLVIKSTAPNIDRRVTIRNTWGKGGVINGVKVKLVFLLGITEKFLGQPLHQSLAAEYRQYGDILQWDFQDSFFNLTLKEIHFLRWFATDCSSAKYVFKGDDDVFVNVFNIIEYVKYFNPDRDLFVGHILYNAIPKRNKKLKYFIPDIMYKNKAYPPYAGGGGYVMSRRTVLQLHHVAADVDLFPIDDVFVGMCLLLLKITPVSHNGFRTLGVPDAFMFDPCLYKDLIVVHRLNPAQIWIMWSLVTDTNFRCAKVTRTVPEN